MKKATLDPKLQNKKSSLMQQETNDDISGMTRKRGKVVNVLHQYDDS